MDEISEAFRQIPDEWRQDVLSQVRLWVNAASGQRLNITGAGDEPSVTPDGQQEDGCSCGEDRRSDVEPAA
jgi:hypothetical protein